MVNPSTVATRAASDEPFRGYGRAGYASSVTIAMHLRRQIVDGHYTYGERLPPERQLAVDFGTSRGTVREALRQLEESSFVSRRAGSGTFVDYRELSDPEKIAEATSPVELMDVRMAVEPQIVRLAVLNANAQDLVGLKKAAERVAAARGASEFSRADESFHLALADCSRNPLMIWLYRHINSVRGHRQWGARKNKILTETCITEYNQQHHKLCEAVVNRDIESALATITTHLEKARADLLGVG